MKKYTVISYKALPVQPPISWTLLSLLLLDRLEAPAWMWLLCCGLLCLMWTAFIVVKQREVVREPPGFGEVPEPQEPTEPKDETT